jgi:hypothetical protein
LGKRARGSESPVSSGPFGEALSADVRYGSKAAVRRTRYDGCEMHDPLAAFERFKFSGEELEHFRSEFKSVIDTTDLARSPELTAAMLKYDKVPAVYFWTAVLESVEFKIYAGKTNSLGYRIRNYSATFQPHSPNDFKLLVFGAFLQELAPAAALRPLLNAPRSPSTEAKAAVAGGVRCVLPLFVRRRFERPKRRTSVTPSAAGAIR